ncbi:hypothetical protein J4573_26830 [Actinomadura barringtoniae]|uniref:DUF2961 domain-containing protein n=1 Tax=Actinomadura barringtoniae TaxID=1427535 RepID=A0A939PDB8_9ACTN|nr:hypothetical protein [Actinomadura barringtoniae]MBO2450747.1 hypothetical protein [Actinomadura barringtoniae]
MAIVLALAGAMTAPRAATPAARADVAQDAAPSNQQYVPVPISAIADTRNGTGGVGTAKLAPGKSVTFNVAGQGQVPATGVSAVSLNISAIGAEKFGWFTVSPSDALTTTATLAFREGESATGQDITRLTSAGKVTVTNNSDGAVHLFVATRGYFLDASATSAGTEYYPVNSAVIYDTRNGTGTPSQTTPIPANSQVTFTVAGKGGIPATGARVAALHVAAVSQPQKGWISLYPSDSKDSGIGVLDYSPGGQDSNLTLAPLSGTGQLTLVNHGSGTVHVSVSVRGYFNNAAEQGGATYKPVEPTNVLNTIEGQQPDKTTTPLGAGASLTFDVVQPANVPASAVDAAAINIGARQPTEAGYLSVYPAGTQDPNISSVNYDDLSGTVGTSSGSDISIPSRDGKLTVTNHGAAPVHVQISVRGYFLNDLLPDPVLKLIAKTIGTGQPHGGGQLTQEEMDELNKARQDDTLASRPLVLVRPKAARAAAFPPCTGIFDEPSATVNIESGPTSLPWSAPIKASTGIQGTVYYANQTFADGYQANSYQPHVEPWDYFFHGSLSNPFPVVGANLSHTMQDGSEVSFLWYWFNIPYPAAGGYAFVNCTYKPGP